VLHLDGTGRLYLQVYRALRGEILGGRLASGERIPSTREIAELLKISRNTAVMAYEQLRAEGYIEARCGRCRDGRRARPATRWPRVAADIGARSKPGLRPASGPEDRRWRKAIPEGRSSL
jgi:DNA-binding transcriptional MocR family regulator